MSAAIAITRTEHTATQLRQEASRWRDSDVVRRMLALALVKEGQSRLDAARSCGMDRQTLRDWVHRCNAAGLAGLADKQGRTGPKPRLSAGQEAKLASLVRSGPDPVSTAWCAGGVWTWPRSSRPILA